MQKISKSSVGRNASAQKTELLVSDADYHLKELTTPYESGDALAAAPLADGRYIAAFRSAENIVPEFFTVGEDFDKYTICNTGMEFRDNAEIFVCFACDSDERFMLRLRKSLMEIIRRIIILIQSVIRRISTVLLMRDVQNIFIPYMSLMQRERLFRKQK